MQKIAIIAILTAAGCFVSIAGGQTPAPTAVSPRDQSTSSAPTGSTASASPNSQQSATPAATSGESPEALARKYIELWNTGDKARIDAFPAFIMHNHGGRVLADPAMLGRVIANWRKSMPDLTFTIDDTVAQGDKVVMRVTLKGTYKERLFPESGDPPSPPRLLRATGIFIFKADDGKLREIWQELDESILRAEMGAQWKTRAELTGDAAADKSKKQDQAPSNAPPPKP